MIRTIPTFQRDPNKGFMDFLRYILMNMSCSIIIINDATFFGEDIEEIVEELSKLDEVKDRLEDDNQPKQAK